MKKIKIIACMLIAISLISCGSKDINTIEADFSNRFIRTNADTTRTNESLGYLIDQKTGVVYLEYDGYRAHAITVMLNADGTPVTKDQLELEV